MSSLSSTPHSTALGLQELLAHHEPYHHPLEFGRVAAPPDGELNMIAGCLHLHGGEQILNLMDLRGADRSDQIIEDQLPVLHPSSPHQGPSPLAALAHARSRP
eukprot:7312291-Prymnesium_polylepis.1